MRGGNTGGGGGGAAAAAAGGARGADEGDLAKKPNEGLANIGGERIFLEKESEDGLF